MKSIKYRTLKQADYPWMHGLISAGLSASYIAKNVYGTEEETLVNLIKENAE